MEIINDNRGKIIYQDRAKQIKDFSRVRFGNITPTDIDGCIEYKNILYVFFELKLIGATIKFGQKLAFERIADDLSKVKPTIYIIAEHKQKDCNENIHVEGAIVKEVRCNNRWEVYNEEIKLYDFIDNYIGYIESLEEE